MQKSILNFFDKIEHIISCNSPFVVYRKPNENEVHLIVQQNSKLHLLDKFTSKGFVFAPFNKQEEKIVFPINESEKSSLKIEDFNDLEIKASTSKITSTVKKEVSKSQHVFLVENTIDYIKNNKAHKVVVSRKELLNVADFDALNSFKKMLKNYENAMVYYWFHPKVGRWMGASPERLIHIKNGKFKTMALAGTQSFMGSVDVTWKAKEKDEQQFVTDYILETINKNVIDIKVSKPYTVKAGNLLHIRTDIFGDLANKKALEGLVESLHPTPAVCGLPKAAATDFILKNEGYNRNFYAGYLGELNVENSTNLYVNLRCMELLQNSIALYIGGGITKDSVALKEWDETVNKAQVMKKIV